MAAMKNLVQQDLVKDLVGKVNKQRVDLTNAIRDKKLNLDRANEGVQVQTKNVNAAKARYHELKTREEKLCEEKVKKAYETTVEPQLKTLERLKAALCKKEQLWEGVVKHATNEVLSTLETIGPLLSNAINKGAAVDSVDLTGSQADEDELFNSVLSAAGKLAGGSSVTPSSSTQTSTKQHGQDQNAGKSPWPGKGTKRTLDFDERNEETPAFEPSPDDDPVHDDHAGPAPANDAGPPSSSQRSGLDGSSTCEPPHS
eukprot:jgi/Mesvir1/7529/Mv25826-RA.1